MTPIDPFALTCVNYQNRDALPGAPGIYYVLNLSKYEILYIGQSKNIQARWNGHHRDWEIGMFQAMYESSIVIAWELCAQSQLNEFEKRRIKEFKPILNGKNSDDTESILFGKEGLEDLPAYYRYLVSNPSQELIGHVGERTFNYLKAKAKLIEVFNYRHLSSRQLVPHYRFFEEECLMHVAINFDNDSIFSKLTNEFHELANNDVRIILDYSKCSEKPWKFESLGWSENKVVLAIAFLFSQFVEAGIKAINAIMPVKDPYQLVLEQGKDPSVKATFLSILRPIYRKAAKGHWEKIVLISDVEFDGKVYWLVEQN